MVSLTRPYLNGRPRWTKFGIISDNGLMTPLEKLPSSSWVSSAGWQPDCLIMLIRGEELGGHCHHRVPTSVRTISCDPESFVLMPCKCIRLGPPEAFPHPEASDTQSLSSFFALRASVTWGFGLRRPGCPLTVWPPSSAWKK